MIPFAIDNDAHRLADVLNELLARSAGCPFDVATAYFSISGYRLLSQTLPPLGAFRLLLGAEPESSADVGLRADPRALQARLRGDLNAEPFTEATLRLVEELIAFLRDEKVLVRLYDRGFLHAKAYLFHQDAVGPHNRGDRLRPFAAIVGSSNFTGPGLAANRELNLVHRVLLPEEEAVDREAAQRAGYITGRLDRETIFDPSGIDVPDSSRRLIKSEVGARAVDGKSATGSSSTFRPRAPAATGSGTSGGILMPARTKSTTIASRSPSGSPASLTSRGTSASRMCSACRRKCLSGFSRRSEPWRPRLPCRQRWIPFSKSSPKC